MPGLLQSLAFIATALGAAALLVFSQPGVAADADGASKSADPAYVLGFTMDRIDGEPQKLSEYEGKVLMIVNVASRCGMTPQYKALQELYEKHAERGLVVLGFPANNFMGQEPGTNEEIAEFCERNYGVTFPMFSKISVKGRDMHPLYQRLTSQPAPIGGNVSWNFQKYIVDRSGRVVAMFGPRTRPDDPKIVELIEKLLGS